MAGSKVRRGSVLWIAVEIAVLVLLLTGVAAALSNPGGALNDNQTLVLSPAGAGIGRAERLPLPDVPREKGLPDKFKMPGRLEANGTHFELENSSYLNITPALYSASVGIAHAEGLPLPDVPHEKGLPDKFKMPGRLEANGTHFEIKNSSYLNITLDSSEPINLTLESARSMVTMHIESASGAARITLGGFAPQTTYNKYEDDYHNHTAFTTDINGKYTYTQDLSSKHLVFIQSISNTIFINDNATGGDCTLIEMWNSVTKTCTLTTDLTQTVQIDSDGITFDGNGHTIKGSGTGNGIYLPARNGVTIKNLNINKFDYGIFLSSSSSNTLSNNIANSNSDTGIYLYYSSSNTLSNNIANSNSNTGIYLFSSSNNTLSNNTANLNGIGIYLDSSSNNTLSNNTANLNGNGQGIYLYLSSSYNMLSGNNVYNNYDGIDLVYSHNNILSSNNVYNNGDGILLDGGSGNILSSNNVYNNGLGFFLYYDYNETLSSNNVYNNGGGIYNYLSNNNTLSGNNVYNNSGYGIYLYFSWYNILSSNNVYNNSYYYSSYPCYPGTPCYGISLHSSSYNILSSNNVYNNSNYGILLEL